MSQEKPSNPLVIERARLFSRISTQFLHLERENISEKDFFTNLNRIMQDANDVGAI